MKIALLGCGAIGACVAAPLHEAGVDITVIEQWDLHVTEIQRHGLRFGGGFVPERRVPLRALHLHEAQTVHGEFDVVFLALKSYDTQWGTLFAHSLLNDPQGPVVTFQNGINEPEIERLLGPGRTFGCVTTLGGELVAPGYIVQTDTASGVDGIGFTVGQWGADTVTDRVEELAKVIGLAANTRTTDDLPGQRWSKLAINCMLNSIAALTGLTTAGVWLEDEPRTASIAMGAEAAVVAAAAGAPAEKVAGTGLPTERLIRAAAGEDPEVDDELVRIAGILTASAGGRPSAAQDARKGRRTEINELNGLVSRLGREHGIPTPANDLIIARMTTLGVGFAPQMSNFDGFVSELSAAAR